MKNQGPGAGVLHHVLKRMPKSETHLHIEGSLPWDLLHRLDPQTFAEPPESWQPDFKFRDFVHFESELLGYAGRWYTSPERYYEAARVIFVRLLSEHNVRYLETSFASGCIDFFNLDADAVAEAIASAAPEGMVVRVFMGIHRDGYHDGNRTWIDHLLACDHLAGIDLHGDEAVPLGSWAPGLWERARAAGKLTKAHAGEFAGPESVFAALDQLKVRRIQHGVRAIEDPECVARLRECGAVLDVCPISNVKLRVAPSIAQHPLRALMDAGVVCTISTDDTLSFGNCLLDEYVALNLEGGFTLEDLANLARNGLMQGPLDDPRIQRALHDLDAWAHAMHLRAAGL